MKLDEEIDRLYQLPLKEFTPARNVLAKEVRGADATRVRTLQKPNVAAWAVNQLYWQKRDVFDRLIAAAERLRTAHRGLLAGKATDLQKAEAAHRDAVRAATQDIRRILDEAGESASAQTMTAVGETLEALPSGEESPGRLTRPLKRMGFEALAGVPARPAGAPPAKLTLVKGREKKAPREPDISPAKKREIEELETRLRTAQTEERQTAAELERMRRELERAERERARAEEELSEAAAKVQRLQDDIAAREKAQKARAAEQEKLERRLEKLRPA
jgi:valyl-tRNA synthetase